MVARLAGTDGVDVDLWIRPGAHGRVAGGTTVPSDVVRCMTEQAWADFRAYFGRIGYVRVGQVRAAPSQVAAIACQIETVLALHAPAAKPDQIASDSTTGA